MSATTPRLPGFTLERLLGRGGSGEVWSARVADSGDRVALKFLSRVSPAAATEAALLETLDHPHLVRMIGMVPTASGSVLVLDLADGGSLAGLLEARGRLAVGEVVTALSPIGLALAHAHLNGVVHADVTPGNILFTAGGLPLLADLGIARITGDDLDGEPGPCTPEYVDPIVASGSVPTAASDVFMLAAVAVHALTGAPIWRGHTAEDRLAAAAAGDLADLAQRLRAAAVSEPVAAVILRAADLDPMKRGTAAGFGLDLRQAAPPVPVDLSAGRLTPRLGQAGRATDVPGTSAPRTGGRHAAPASPGGPSQVFTRIAGSRPRPALPRQRTRGRLRLSPRWSAVAAFLVAALAGGGVAWALVGGSGDARPVARQTSAVSLPGLPVDAVTTSPASVSLPASSSATPSSSITPPDITAAQAAGVLAQLDSLRQQAFAKRIPLLLTGVYPTGSLLDADTALLQRLVPAGCGLEGVQTTYSQVKIVGRAEGTVVVSADVALHESYLVCDGRVTAKAPSTAAQLLRITLVWRGNGYLIGDIAR